MLINLLEFGIFYPLDFDRLKMFKKAFRYDESVVFYFDTHDNKYVATGGSLAWRLNNPGLLLSHSLHRTGYHGIGAHHQYAIFADPLIGKAAFRAWMCSTKFCDSPLTELGKYYQPNNPKKYLEQLCALTGFTQEIKPRSLPSKDFERLLIAIQQLAGFTPENKHSFLFLPKITAKFYSANRKIEFYLAGYENLLTKAQALEWVETHKLDAVTVHKNNGEVYLRSRPRHHFDQICFTQKEYGIEQEFKDAVRETGVAKKGQCIWGFINGLLNTPKKALRSANLISHLADGQCVWYLVNDVLQSNSEVADQLRGHHSETIKFGAQFFKMLIGLSDQSPSKTKPPIVVITHSQGALIASLALTRLALEEQQRIRVFTLGGASIVLPNVAHPESHNYFSIADIIPRLTTHELSLFLLDLHQGAKTGLTIEQVIEQLIQKDIEIFITTQDKTAVDIFREKRLQHYKKNLEQVRNTTILDGDGSAWEHAFLTPCYQKVLKGIIEEYK